VAIVPTQIPRQTLPYGDRAFVNPDTGLLTIDAYQYMQRLAQGMVGTVSNVSTVIATTNTIVTDLAGVDLQLAVLTAELTQLETTVGMIDTSSGTAPPPSLPPPGLNMATALGLAFFFG